MKPPSVQSPFAHVDGYPSWGDVSHLLRGRYPSLIAPTDSCANPAWLSPPSALASFKESSQVATSPCCHRDLPDVISVNLSSDAWSHTTAVPRCSYLFLPPCHRPSPTGVGSASRSTREHDFPRSIFGAADISLCSGLQVCSSPRSFLPLRTVSAGQPRLLRPGRTCFVTSARTGYASRPNTGN
jgi:hypothetical protein